MKKALEVIPLILAGLMASLSSPVQSEERQAESLTPLSAQSPQGVSYLSGGVGIGERRELLAAAQMEEYNLHLVFALHQGKYLSDVDVVIENRRQEEILAVTTRGPWLFASLPPGRYTVHATMYAETITREIRLDRAQRTKVQLLW